MNMTQLCYFKEQLKQHRYAPTTTTNYCKHIQPFLTHFEQEVKELSQEELQQYIDQTTQQADWSFSTRKQCISALRLFYNLLYKRPIKLLSKASQRQLYPPYTFTCEQLKQLLRATKNNKHKSILMAVYSGGLRVSEVAHLRLKDVDGASMQLHIADSKGQYVVRSVPLSKYLWTTLQDYCKQYRPQYWLFEGPQQNAYSTRSIQNIFDRTRALAQLPNKATISTLRHSFALHSLQQGADIYQINQLLGHQSLTTTQRYVRLLQSTSAELINPLDLLIASN